MKKISVLFLSVFMLMFVSCSQLFDFSAKNASVSFSIPESMMNDLRDQGATPVKNSLIINIVVKDQNGEVVKSISEPLLIDNLRGEIRTEDLPFNYTINKLPLGNNYSISVDFFYQEEAKKIDYLYSAYAYGIDLQSGKTTQVKMTLNRPSDFIAKVYYMDGNEEKTITMPANELKIFYKQNPYTDITYDIADYYINENCYSFSESKYVNFDGNGVKSLIKVEYCPNKENISKTYPDFDTLDLELINPFYDDGDNVIGINFDNNETLILYFDNDTDTQENHIHVKNYTTYVSSKDNRIANDYISCFLRLNFIPFYEGITEVLSGKKSIPVSFEIKEEHAIALIPLKDIIGEKYKPFINDTVMFKLQVEDKKLTEKEIFYNIFPYEPADVVYDNCLKIINNDTAYLVFNNFTEDLFNSSVDSSYLYINIGDASFAGDQNIILDYVVFPQKDNVVVFSINNQAVDADEDSYLEQSATPNESDYRYEYKYVISENEQTNPIWSNLYKNDPIAVDFRGELCSFSFDNPSYTPAEKSFYNVLCDSQGYYRRLSNKKPIEQDKITINNSGKYSANYDLDIKTDYTYPIYFHLYSECNESDLSTLYLIKDFKISVYNVY